MPISVSREFEDELLKLLVSTNGSSGEALDFPLSNRRIVLRKLIVELMNPRAQIFSSNVTDNVTCIVSESSGWLESEQPESANDTLL